MTFTNRFGWQIAALTWRFRFDFHGSAAILIRSSTKPTADVIQGGLLTGRVEDAFGTVEFHQVTDLA